MQQGDEIKFLILFFLFPIVARSETLTLLDIPLNDGSKFPYQVELQKECSFEGVKTISTPILDLPQENQSLLNKLLYIQRKLNLLIDKYEINPERITFSIAGAENIFFEFYFKKEDCKLVRVLHYNDKQFNMRALEIDYSTFIISPVLKKIIVRSETAAEQDLYIYPWALRGQMSLYELNVGPAINIHSNIRINDQNRFNKNDPVVEPIPAFFFRYGPVFLNKNGLGSLLFHYKDFTILGMGLLEGEPYHGIGLNDRKTGVFIGTIFKFNLAELTYYNDFFKDKGYTFKLNLVPEFYYRLSWKFSPQIFIQYWDNRYVDYYFGVTNQESMASGFRPYRGTHTINYGAGLEIMHFKEKWTFVVSLGEKFYGQEVFNSPTVNQQQEYRFVASVLYKLF